MDLIPYRNVYILIFRLAVIRLLNLIFCASYSAVALTMHAIILVPLVYPYDFLVSQEFTSTNFMAHHDLCQEVSFYLVGSYHIGDCICHCLFFCLPWSWLLRSPCLIVGLPLCCLFQFSGFVTSVSMPLFFIPGLPYEICSFSLLRFVLFLKSIWMLWSRHGLSQICILFRIIVNDVTSLMQNINGCAWCHVFNPRPF